jgi:hypothetical protein
MTHSYRRSLSLLVRFFLLIAVLIGCQRNDDIEEGPSVIPIANYTFEIPQIYGRFRPTPEGSSARGPQVFSLTVSWPEMTPVSLVMARPLTRLEYDKTIFIDVSSNPMIDLDAYVQRYQPAGRLRFLESFNSVSNYFFYAMSDRSKSDGDREVYIHNENPKFYASCDVTDDTNERHSCRLQSAFLDISFSASFSKSNISSLSEIQHEITKLLSTFVR